MADARRWRAEHPDHATAIPRGAALARMRTLSEAGVEDLGLDLGVEALASGSVRAGVAHTRCEAEGKALDVHLGRGRRSVRDLERAIRLPPGVLDAVMTEGLAGPVPKRLAREAGAQLRVGPRSAAAIIEVVPKGAVWRHAGSRSAQPRLPRTFAEAIGATNASDEHKACWLGDW